MNIHINKDLSTLFEAVFWALLLTLFHFVTRSFIVNHEGIGTGAFTWRIIGLFVWPPITFCVFFVVERRWLGLALAATGLGLVYGLGVSGGPLNTLGSQWDMKLLWYYINGTLDRTNPSYQFYTSAALVSLSGIILTLVAATSSFGILERTAQELRRMQSHKGTERYRSRETVFGDAKWGSWQKISKVVGDANGIVLGEDYDPRHSRKVFSLFDEKTWGLGGKSELITLSPKFDSGHVNVFSGPGGGKTAGIVISTCLNYKNSIIVVDPEFEILKATKAAREDMGRKVRVIKSGQGINLLLLLDRIKDDRDQVFAHLAKMITDPEKKQSSEVGDFFRQEAQNVISGLLNHYYSQGEKNPFFELLKTISKSEDDFKASVEDIVKKQKKDSLLHLTLASYKSMDSRTFTSFQATIKQSLKWAPYKKLLELVSTEPEDSEDIFDPKTDLYIQIKKSDLETYPGLVRLLLGTIAYVIDNAPDSNQRIMIVDEAYQIGRISTFERIRDTSRKKKLHLIQIFQTTGQLRELYGAAGVSAWKNSVAASVYSSIEDEEEQEKLSKAIGEYTADIEGNSKSSSVRGLGMGSPTSSSSQNTSLRNVRLMRPEQLRTLPADGFIILFKGNDPIVCGKAFCFRRKEWQKYTPFIKE